MQQPIFKETEDTRSVAELVGELRDEARTLFRQETLLLRAEMAQSIRSLREGATEAGIGAGLLGAGGALLILAVTVALYAVLVAIGVSNMVSGFLAPLILGVLFVAIGYPLLRKGQENLKGKSLTPERTLDTVKEDKEWLKSKIQ